MSKSSDTSGKKKNSDMNMMRMVRFIGRFIRGEVHVFSLAGLMLIFESATFVLNTLLLAFVVDYLGSRLNQIDGKAILPMKTPLQMIGLPTIINPDVDTIAIVTIGFVLLNMINSLGDSLAEIYLARGGRRVGYNLRVSLYAHLQKLSLAFHDQRRTGDVMTRITSDVAALEDFIIKSLSDFVGSILTVVFILVAIVTQAWQVALLTAIIMPVLAIISNYFTTRIKAASKRLRASEGELASAAQEMLASIRVIQTYGLGSYEQSMFSKQSQKSMDTALEAAAYQARFSWVVSVINAASVAAVIWLAVYLIFRTPVTAASIGLLTAYIKFVQDMFKPTKRIIAEWNTFGKLYASVERIGDLMDMKPSVQDEPGAVEAQQLKGHIEFRNVAFAYPAMMKEDGSEGTQRMTLKNINFEAKPGQVIAVVGYTGAGKSTIAQLIPRLYDPNSGEVCIDGQNIRKFTLDSLRSQISMVLQESILFSGSVVENIGYGRPDATGAEIVAAAKQANAHEFIEKLPEGYYTMLGERGSNLSGGQRQRLAIARAFVRNTPILIMDEPTTGLDAESTDLVLRALKKLMKGKTTIIISHDLNLIREVDQIIVIKAGEVEQMGTHDELLATGGLYASLYARQTGQAVPQKGSSALATPVGAAMPVTGTSAAPAASLTNIIDFDLPRSPHFANRLPNLIDAFNPDTVIPILQEALIHSDKFTITNCIPGKAIYLADHSCNMQFDLKIRDNHTGKTEYSVVNASLFPDAAPAKAFYHKLLEPLAKQAAGRPEMIPFSNPVAYLEQLHMAVAVFPIDGLMPTLLTATDPQRMIEIFTETLPEALSGNLNIRSLKLDLAHYGRYQRCVLRYNLEGDPEDSPNKMVVYGKVDADGQGGLTVPVIAALRERLRDPDAPFDLRIPMSYGYLPNHKLLLMEAIPGQPVAKRLINNYRGDIYQQYDDGLSLAEAVEICARMAATIHWTGIRLGRRLPFQAKVAGIQEELKIVQEVFPELGNTLNAWLEEIIEFSDSTPAMPLIFSHGDYTYTQLIFSGKDAGLVDFDTVCQAEPALDLGQYIAYQRLSISKEQDQSSPFTAEVVEQLCELFLQSYIDVARPWMPDEALLRARVSIYENLSLIRLVIHSWQKLKGNRLHLAVQLLEERMSCLKQIS